MSWALPPIVGRTHAPLQLEAGRFVLGQGVERGPQSLKVAASCELWSGWPAHSLVGQVRLWRPRLVVGQGKRPRRDSTA